MICRGARHPRRAVAACILHGDHAVDEPIFNVSQDSVDPQRLEVHIGEVVRWRAAGGEPLRIAFDPDRDAHEVIVRPAEIHVVFLREGKHWCVGSFEEDSRRSFRGVAGVWAARGSVDLPTECDSQSSRRMCIIR